MLKNLIIIDDDPIANEMLMDLANERLEMTAHSFYSGEEFLKSPPLPNRCVYLIDWNLPGIQGPDLVKIIRERDKLSPIFMISGNHQRDCVLSGLKAGADDYLIKPFEPEELITKIQNAKTRSSSILENMMNVGLKLIPEGDLVIKDGEKISLTTREFQVFKALHDSPRETHSRIRLISMFKDNETTERNIDVLVFSLRKKISRIGVEIDTVRGQGYRLSL